MPTKRYLRQEYRDAAAETKCRRPPRHYPGPLHRDIREYHAVWKRIRCPVAIAVEPDPDPKLIAGPRRAKTSGSSRFRGVYRRQNGLWEVKLRVGKRVVLNRTFAAEEDAARACQRPSPEGDGLSNQVRLTSLSPARGSVPEVMIPSGALPARRSIVRH